ncbi:Polyketide cyclase / dehydrase and lipid transport [Tsuneonella dongtanensis]|uniref:Polyketide cyclase / dehydrase and lipid transport n=1 Tax=Tsuneonella dongtanensis TaxID=692370 RepID=A0A1B2ACF3_9SPHN|nr:hypothetical protein [Tsuneonella dongtanensis]ANY19817.1 Polyketide cyclase / dehydrase and lipid transport [Tsuneonella dongtanensis]
MSKTALSAMLALSLAAPAAAEVVETSDDHFVTRDTAVVKAAPNAAWLALISPGDWWDDAHTWSGKAANMMLTPQGGGCFCERIPEKDSTAAVGLAGSAQHMSVVMAEPMKVLRMRGGLGPLQSEPVDGVLTITMQPDKASGGTKIVWEYIVAGHMRFPVATISKAVDGVMSQQLGHLAGKLGRVDAPAPKAAPKPPAKQEATPSDKPSEKPSGKVAPADNEDVGAALDAMDRKTDKPK